MCFGLSYLCITSSVCCVVLRAAVTAPGRFENNMAHANDLGKIFHLLREIEHRQAEIERKFVIAQSTLDASLAGLTSAVNAAIAALATANTATSTPDTVVSAYQSSVDAQTVALASATPPPVAATLKK